MLYRGHWTILPLYSFYVNALKNYLKISSTSYLKTFVKDEFMNVRRNDASREIRKIGTVCNCKKIRISGTTLNGNNTFLLSLISFRVNFRKSSNILGTIKGVFLLHSYGVKTKKPHLDKNQGQYTSIGAKLGGPPLIYHLA